MSPRSALALRATGGAAVLALVVGAVGTGPFLAGLRAVGPPAVVASTALAAVATCACAWRWVLVARRLDTALALPAALRACYRAQLLNLVLPGGVLGDVDRGVRHGRATRSAGPALRSVAWERLAGQAVQAAVLLVALLVLPGPVGAGTILLGVVAIGGGGGLLLLVGRSSRARWLRAVGGDLRRAFGAPRVVAGVVAGSLVALACHVVTFLLAARLVGVHLPVARLVPLALLVLVAAAVPVNLAGWGPREGMAAWAFAVGGAGADAGAAAATAYGVLVLAAHVPALVLLLPQRPASPVVADRPSAGRYAGG